MLGVLPQLGLLGEIIQQYQTWQTVVQLLYIEGETDPDKNRTVERNTPLFIEKTFLNFINES